MPVPGDRTTVLYVDDDPLLLDIGKTFLEKMQPFAVDTVPSAEAALEMLGRKSYDSIISDYQMPEMDGIALLKTIRARYPDLPFILFTGRGREEVVIQAFDAGADYYIQKGGEARSQFRELSHKIQLAVRKRSIERELRFSEERYRSVVEDQSEFICRFRPDGTHAFVNDAYCRYFGMAKESLIGHRFSPRIPEPDAGSICRHFAALTPGNPVAAIEHRVIMPDGSIRWHHWSDRAIFDETGRIIEYQSVGQDITDRKSAELGLMQKNEELHAAYEQIAATEEELRSSYDDLAASQRALGEKEMTLNAVLEESPIPQFVIDCNHRVRYWNHALAAYSGVSAREVIGTDHQWRAFYPTPRPSLADLLLDGAVDRLPELYGSKFAKSSLIGDAYEVTDFFPRMGGGGTWLHFTAGLIRDRDGGVIGAVESLQDITEQKAAEAALMKRNEDLASAYEELTAVEEELRSNFDELAASRQQLEQSEQRYRNVVEDQAELISRFLPDGTHIFVNGAYCRYFGMSPGEIIGRKFRPEIPAEDRARIGRLLASLTPENPVGTITQRIVMPDGSTRWQQWSDRAIFDAGGRITEFQSVGRDVPAP